MQRLGQNIYANFKKEQSKNKSSDQVSILLLGNCGVGKSKLTNNICSSSQEVGITKKSLTTFLYKGNCKYEKLLAIYDSPGLGSKDERSQNQLLSALMNHQFNAVIVIAKFDARFRDNTLTQLVKISKIFKEQVNMVIFLISHLEMIENQKDLTFIKFRECLEQQDITEKVILFSNQNSDFQELSKVLYQCTMGSPKKRLSIEKKKIKIMFKCIQITDQFDEIISDSRNNKQEKSQKIELNKLKNQKKQTKQKEEQINNEDKKYNKVEKNKQKNQSGKKNKGKHNYQKKTIKRDPNQYKTNKKHRDNHLSSKNFIEQNPFNKYRYSQEYLKQSKNTNENSIYQNIRINPCERIIYLIIILMITLTFLIYDPAFIKKNQHRNNLKGPQHKIYIHQTYDKNNKKQKLSFDDDGDQTIITPIEQY